jgi:hypothetical protein
MIVLKSIDDATEETERNVQAMQRRLLHLVYSLLLNPLKALKPSDGQTMSGVHSEIIT